MKYIKSICLAACYAAFFSCGFIQTVYGQSLETRPRPEWVTSLSVPQISKARLPDVADGVYFLIYDQQYRWEKPELVDYRRRVLKVVDPSGMEYAAQIKLTFDPNYESPTLHSIRVQRDGIWKDRTSSVEFDLLRQEERISEGILDGEFTALANLTDIRVGDILDVEYSIRSTDPVFPDNLALKRQTEFAIPLGTRHIAISVPDSTLVRTGTRGFDESPVKISGGAYTTYSWLAHDPDPVHGEANTPEGYPYWGYMELSTWQHWSDISKALESHYRPVETLPQSYADKIAAIRKQYPHAKDRITEALRLVQDEIRYLGLEMGAGGFVPHRPETVLERGYGDCKDKSLLLTSALRFLNIEAHVALVHTSKGYELPDGLPTQNAFNHAIVKAVADGQVYWLDPTRSHQGGRGKDIIAPDYGYALVVGDSEQGLEQIPRPSVTYASTEITETYTMPKSDAQSLKLEVQSVILGPDADNMRHRVATTGIRNLTKSYLEYYSDRYAGITPSQPPIFIDDRDSNRITVFEHYKLAFKDFKYPDLLTDFPIRADAVLGELPEPAGINRRSPVDLGKPRLLVHNVRIHDAVNGFRPPKNIQINNEAFEFSRETMSSGKTLWLKWNLRIKQATAPAARITDYLRDVKKATDSAYLGYNFTNFLNKLTAINEPSSKQTDDGQFASYETTFAMWLVIAVIAFYLIFTIFSLRFGLKADREYADTAVYFPVSVTKFLIMSVLTLNFYPYFWFLKFWIWEKRDTGRKIYPAWRMIFSFLWLYPAFKTARDRSPQGHPKIHTTVGILAAIYYVISQLPGQSHASTTSQLIDLAVAISGGLALLPVVITVNRLNDKNGAAYQRNSRFNVWNYVGIVLGTLVLLAAVSGIIFSA